MVVDGLLLALPLQNPPESPEVPRYFLQLESVIVVKCAYQQRFHQQCDEHLEHLGFI